MNIYVSELCGKNGSELAYSLLACAYMELTGKKMPEIRKTPMGKPYFADDPNIHFSISHTKTHAACAIGYSPVGVDIEIFRTPSPRIISRIAAESELSQFAFIELWTLKESYIKFTGDNTLKIKDMIFSRIDSGIIGPNNTFCRLYSDVSGCQIAVCTDSPNIPETIIDYTGIIL